MTHLLLLVIYLAFISLGLPDAMLGSAWPSIYEGFGVPVSYAGIISMTISAGTIFSSLQSDRLTRWLGSGKVTAISVGMTAVALFGFSISDSFWMMFLWAIPYGLGAGSVDASLNNYVALHYESRHMSWLHCMWGLGAATGPYIMGLVLTGGQAWNTGYRYVALFQILLTTALFFSLPLWKKRADGISDDGKGSKALSIPQVLAIPGAKEVLLAFFGYCAIEQTAILWSSSYLVLNRGFSAEDAASFGSMYLIGITVGRAISGFITMKLSDTQMIRLGEGILTAGLLLILLPLGNTFCVMGLILAGLGCAPIYPCIIHSTPVHFGAENSQAVIGIQMASAYIGSLVMPAIFGLIANHVNIALFPFYIFLLLVIMFVMYEKLEKISPIN